MGDVVRPPPGFVTKSIFRQPKVRIVSRANQSGDGFDQTSNRYSGL